MLVIRRPRRVGDRWIVEGQLYTQMGVVELRAEGNELLAARALERVQPVAVSGVLDDITNAVRRVAQSKAFAQVLKGAGGVLSNPLFRGVASKLPIVSSILSGADAAFALADGIRTGKMDANSLLQKAQGMVHSSNPSIARKGRVILQGVNVAQTAATLWNQYQSGDANARKKVKALKAAALAGEPAQLAAYKAVKAARKYQLRETAAELVRTAMNGSPEAAGKLNEIWQGAQTGNAAAKEAAKLLRSVVIEKPRERAEVGMDLDAHEEAALSLFAPDHVGGEPALTQADKVLRQTLADLRAYTRRRRAA